MDTLPRRVFSLFEEIFDRYWARVVVCVGVLSFIIFSLVGLASMFTYMRVSHDCALAQRKSEARLLMDVHNYAAQVAGLKGEIRGYREVIASLSSPGKRIPLGRFRVTAYDPVESTKPFNDDHTSVGLKIVDDGGNVMRGVVAVDPGKIPYGSTIYLRQLNLLAYAADTGAAMKKHGGKNIDILVPTVAEAMQFGVQYVDVELIDVGN